MNVFYTVIYNAVLFCYVKLIFIASFFNPKAKKWIDGRKNIFNEIKSKVNSEDENVWFHCASLGEFEQCRPLIERYRETFPNHKIVLTFFSPSGYDIQKNYDKANFVFYLPYDSRQNAKRFIELINPRLAIFVKYEFWWHYLNTLDKNSIPAILVSGVFRKNQIFFTTLGKPFSSILYLYKQLFVQDEQSLQLLTSVGLTNAQIAHDTRFDRVISVANNTQSLPIIESFCKNSTVFIAGSTWHEDEKMLADFYSTSLLTNNIKLIIAPHEIGKKHIELLQKQFNNSVLYSNQAEVKENSKILIIDTIGILSCVYRYGNWAYIGGGFGDGIHNILEPAVYGLPVFFGPNWNKFNEAKNLLASGGAFCITNFENLNSSFESVKNINEVAYTNIVKANKKFVTDNGGGTEKILSYLKELITGKS